MSDVSELYFCSQSIADQHHVKSGKSRLLRLLFFFEFIICKHLFFETSICNGEFRHGGDRLFAPGFRRIAQGMLKYGDPQSS